MTGLTSLEVYNSIFKITEENNKFDFHTDNFEKISFTELKNELEEILGLSNMTPKHLRHDIIGTRIIKALKKLRSEKFCTDGYFILLMGYARSPYRDFESYFGVFVDLDEKSFQLIFITCEIPAGFHSIKNISEVVYTTGDHEGTTQIE